MGHKSRYTYGFVHNVYPHSMWAADRSGDGENYRVYHKIVTCSSPKRMYYKWMPAIFFSKSCKFCY